MRIRVPCNTVQFGGLPLDRDEKRCYNFKVKNRNGKRKEERESMREYLQEKDSVLRELESPEDGSGLSSSEAEARLAKYGKNALQEGKKESLLRRFLRQLAEPMTLVLIAAAAVSAVTAVIGNEFPSDVFIILAVVLINAVLGTVQESKAENAIDALREMAAQTAKVLRDGRIAGDPGRRACAGDVILLEAGDAVPADARLLETASLKIEEAALTGESLPVEKSSDALSAPKSGDVALGDRRNMVYTGATAVYGRGKAVVTATGMQTEMGKIAGALADAEEGKTPAPAEAVGSEQDSYTARSRYLRCYFRGKSSPGRVYGRPFRAVRCLKPSWWRCLLPWRRSPRGFPPW